MRARRGEPWRETMAGRETKRAETGKRTWWLLAPRAHWPRTKWYTRIVGTSLTGGPRFVFSVVYAREEASFFFMKGRSFLDKRCSQFAKRFSRSFRLNSLLKSDDVSLLLEKVQSGYHIRNYRVKLNFCTWISIDFDKYLGITKCSTREVRKFLFLVSHFGSHTYSTGDRYKWPP